MNADRISRQRVDRVPPRFGDDEVFDGLDEIGWDLLHKPFQQADGSVLIFPLGQRP